MDETGHKNTLDIFWANFVSTWVDFYQVSDWNINTALPSAITAGN